MVAPDSLRLVGSAGLGAVNERYALLALVTDAYGGHGGIAQYNRDLLSAFMESGAASSIFVAPRLASGPVIPPAGIRQSAARKDRTAFALSSLRLALANHVDVVFCGHLFMTPLARLLAQLKGAKLIVQMHGIEAWQRPGRLCREAVEAADLVLCVSRYTRHAVLGWAAIIPERAIVLPNTIGTQFALGAGGDLRRSWALEGKRVLLSVGRMSAQERYKGHDRIIRALPSLITEGIDAVYVIVGDGDDCARLQAMAVANGVAERVRFTGALSSATLVKAYRMADLFVMPSTGEGFGIAFLEAMACGTPALGLDIAGAPDALAEGDVGAMTSEADLPQTISRMLLANEPRDRQKLSNEVNRRFGRAEFTKRAAAAIGLLQNTDA